MSPHVCSHTYVQHVGGLFVAALRVAEPPTLVQVTPTGGAAFNGCPFQLALRLPSCALTQVKALLPGLLTLLCVSPADLNISRPVREPSERTF